MMSKTYR